MKIKIDTVNKEIVICEKVSIDELSLFLTGLKDMMDLDEFSISSEPIINKEYITIKEIIYPWKDMVFLPNTNQHNPWIITY